MLKLTDGFTAIFDCQIRKPEKDDDGNEVYDVKKDLLDELQTVNDKPFVDLFVNSHPHMDHCLGYDANFYHGNSDDYDDTNKEFLTGLRFSDVQNLQWKNIMPASDGGYCMRIRTIKTGTDATLQIAAGTDIYTVSKMLTHRNVTTTQIYADLVNAKKRETVNKITLK